MSLSQTCVAKLYTSVIDDVIGGVREYFMDEGVDEQVLMELKHTWETRLQQTRAVEVKQDVEPQPPILPGKTVVTNKTVGNHVSQAGSGQQTTAMPIEFASKNLAIQIKVPPQEGQADAPPRFITMQVPTSVLQGNQLNSLLGGPLMSATMALPPHLATTLLQQHVTASLQGQATGVIQTMPSNTGNNGIQNTTESSNNRQNFQQQTGGVTQLDGQNDTSDDDDDEEEDEDEADDDDDDDAEERDDEENDDIDGGAEEEPLNSGDDVSEEDPSDLFETDNVVVCQYDKITRSRNKWKFYLKDGIMNLGGKDYVFQKSNGDAEW